MTGCRDKKVTVQGNAKMSKWQARRRENINKKQKCAKKCAWSAWAHLYTTCLLMSLQSQNNSCECVEELSWTVALIQNRPTKHEHSRSVALLCQNSVKHPRKSLISLTSLVYTDTFCMLEFSAFPFTRIKPAINEWVNKILSLCFSKWQLLLKWDRIMLAATIF